jgi:hypothetical protein
LFPIVRHRPPIIEKPNNSKRFLQLR